MNLKTFSARWCLPQNANTYFDSLVQDCSNPIANAMELLLVCIKPAICWYYRSSTRQLAIFLAHLPPNHADERKSGGWWGFLQWYSSLWSLPDRGEDISQQRSATLPWMSNHTLAMIAGMVGLRICHGHFYLQNLQHRSFILPLRETATGCSLQNCVYIHMWWHIWGPSQ